MPRLIFFMFCALGITLSSCKDDDSRSCITCSSDQTPAFELCRESNGNASVNGEDTGTDYDIYFEGLQASGTNCGG
ncbi:MAG: hypothetical protein AAFP76_07535 [Bacteroidota bacterium]